MLLRSAVSSFSVFLFVQTFVWFGECRHKNVEPRFRENNEDKLEDFFHAAALEELVGWKTNGSFIKVWTYTCGGSIIHEYFILSSSICLGNNGIALRFIVGNEYDPEYWEDDENVFDVDQLIYTVYEESPSLMLFRLVKPIKFNSKVQSIRMSPLSHRDDKYDMELIVTSWTLIKPGKTAARKLRSSAVAICSDQDLDPDDPKVRYQLATEVCTITVESNADAPCPVDNGNGLIHKINGTSYLYGVYKGRKNLDCQKQLYHRLYARLDSILYQLEKWQNLTHNY